MYEYTLIYKETTGEVKAKEFDNASDLLEFVSMMNAIDEMHKENK